MKRSARKRPSRTSASTSSCVAATSLGAAGRGLRVAEAHHRAALEHQQELPLQLEIQVGDLVEEQRAAVRLLEDARVILDGAGVRAPPRAEQVRRQQRRRDRAEVGHHQRPLGARARVDHVLGQEALAGAGLALDQHRQRRAREHLQLAAQLRHRRRASPEDAPFAFLRRGGAAPARARSRRPGCGCRRSRSRTGRPADRRGDRRPGRSRSSSA